MSLSQRLVPIGICFAFAAGVTYYTFQPAFEATRAERQARSQARRDLWNTRYDSPSTAPSSSSLAPTRDHKAATVSRSEDLRNRTEERVANAGGATGIPKDAPRWAEVQRGQFAGERRSFEWSGVPLDRYSEQGGQDDVRRKTDE